MKKTMKIKRDIRIAFSLHTMKMVILVIVSIPIIINILYSIPALQKIIVIESNAVLTYFGTSLGLLSSVSAYSSQQRKSIKEREKRNRPHFKVLIGKTQEKNVFNIEICNDSGRLYEGVYFYDEYVAHLLDIRLIKKISFHQYVTRSGKAVDCNIVDESIIDSEDGYPQYFQISCNDEDNDIWVCTFKKYHNGDYVYYIQDEVECF